MFEYCTHSPVLRDVATDVEYEADADPALTLLNNAGVSSSQPLAPGGQEEPMTSEEQPNVARDEDSSDSAAPPEGLSPDPEETVTILKINEYSQGTLSKVLEMYGEPTLAERVEATEPMEPMPVTSDELKKLHKYTDRKRVASSSTEWENTRMRIEERYNTYATDN